MPHQSDRLLTSPLAASRRSHRVSAVAELTSRPASHAWSGCADPPTREPPRLWKIYPRQAMILGPLIVHMLEKIVLQGHGWEYLMDGHFIILDLQERKRRRCRKDRPTIFPLASLPFHDGRATGKVKPSQPPHIRSRRTSRLRGFPHGTARECPCCLNPTRRSVISRVHPGLRMSRLTRSRCTKL